jgi:putative peptide zinc metalloprotease protein
VPSLEQHRVSLGLVPDPGWLPLVEDVVRRFADRLGFSRRLTEMVVSAVLEACDNLALAAGQAGIVEACRVDLAAGDGAVTVDIAYNGKIPLNPLATEDYEVPDAGCDPDCVKADALWLHLIKRRMDKVFFRVEGSRHVLSLVKYRRQEGREGEVWVLRRCPKLSAHARLDIHEAEDGRVRGLVYNPTTGVALRLGPSELFIVRRLDGVASLYDIYLEHIDALGLISPGALASLYENLECHGLLQTEAGAARRPSLLRRLVNPNFSIPNADAVIDVLYRRLGFLVGPLGAGILVALGLSGFYPLLAEARSPLSIAGLEAFYLDHPLALVILYGMMLGTVAVHELAHGLVCKHYGGRVHRLGVMFYLGMFVFYCDTTSAYTFPRTSQKLLVSLAGPLTSLAFLALGLWMARGLAGTGSQAEYLWVSFNVLCLFGLVMDANPCIKMDGYYMLMDWLGLPNLRERSFAYLRKRLLGRFFPQAPGQGQREPDARERRVFWWYGLCGALFSLAFIVWPIAHYTRILWRHSASQGRIIWAALLLSLALMRLARQAYARIHAWRHREYRIH